jgi:hypothetical protein
MKQSIPVPGRGALAGYCLVTSDCTGDNECCASFETPNGAVALDNLASGLRKFINGYCETIGTADSGTLRGRGGATYCTPCMMYKKLHYVLLLKRKC